MKPRVVDFQGCNNPYCVLRVHTDRRDHVRFSLVRVETGESIGYVNLDEGEVDGVIAQLNDWRH